MLSLFVPAQAAEAKDVYTEVGTFDEFEKAISNGEHNIKLTDNLCQMGQNLNANVNLNNTYLDIDLDDHILEISSLILNGSSFRIYNGTLKVKNDSPIPLNNSSIIVDSAYLKPGDSEPTFKLSDGTTGNVFYVNGGLCNYSYKNDDQYSPRGNFNVCICKYDNPNKINTNDFRKVDDYNRLKDNAFSYIDIDFGGAQITSESFYGIKLPEEITLTSPTPDKVFNGWRIEADRANPDRESGLVTYMVPIFKDRYLDVTFDANGGICNESTRKIKYGTPIGELPKAYTEVEGVELEIVGWALPDNTMIDEEYIVTEDLTLTAMYEEFEPEDPFYTELAGILEEHEFSNNTIKQVINLLKEARDNTSGISKVASIFTTAPLNIIMPILLILAVITAIIVIVKKKKTMLRQTGKDLNVNNK